MAGSPCPIEVMKKVQSQMNMHEVTIAYGMTETSPVSTQCATDDPVERRVSTVGQVLPHIEIKIVDPEGKAVPRGATGEFCTRGYSVMKGYWNDAGEDPRGDRRGGLDAAPATSRPWTKRATSTSSAAEGHGDPGRRERLSARDRGVPLRHPKIQDVQVIGVPDPRYGEEICAWIKLHGPERHARGDPRFCKGQIAHYKIPRYIEFVPEFPMTITGKIQKFVMREQTIEKLGLKAEKTA
jgi:Acyl-CoA synthetases (AMP-forming)/AMP-acid ligases II